MVLGYIVRVIIIDRHVVVSSCSSSVSYISSITSLCLYTRRINVIGHSMLVSVSYNLFGIVSARISCCCDGRFFSFAITSTFTITFTFTITII